MSNLRETAWNHIAGEQTGTFYTAEQKWINKIMDLKETHPDEVDIRHINPDGSIVAHLPISWFKVSQPRKVSDEFREEARARLAAYRASNSK